ncbi:MAG: FecR domain-containing protein [Acidobacteriaceae bacterium]|nr:FecR domain-containing protein [Acidobacteriaceae bacterium]MBV9781773.1 FecR domain-containing protein [Acidobacteriaceae bacterium]
MNEKYLWDRTGQPDPEIADLEELLRPLRYEASPENLPLASVGKPVSRISHRWLFAWKIYSWQIGLAAAAVVVCGIGLGIVFSARRGAMQESDMPAWKVYANGSKPRSVRSGQTIETGEYSNARLESDFIGEVRVEPKSRLRILETRKEEQRLALQRGTIHAFIWAPPRQFVVETPSATTIDLGCRYTLHVGADGRGSLDVEMGWVAFQWGKLESFIPEGATCKTRAGKGPGTPYFLDAEPEFAVALDRFDENGDVRALDVVIRGARQRDGLTLWHLLSRTEGEERGKVFARFSELVRIPPEVTLEKVLRGDPEALDAAWNALELGNTDWWREWKRKW